MTPSKPSKTLDFRLDINGLRAIAVALVVLYHFKAPIVSSGFVGVDCFFVISGYLMTKIIEDGLAAHCFSLVRFYEARAVRILPALIALLVSLLVFGYVFLEPGAYRSLGAAAAAASVFVSDWKFALEKGYFNPSSERNWLLHTWSLSVEWQFYLAYPVVYTLLSRMRWLWSHRIAILVGVAVASFTLNAVFVSYGGRLGTFAFFLMPLRAWEMIAGGLVYLLASRFSVVRYGRLLEAAGLILIAAAAVSFHRTSLWPSFGALAPTLGTTLVILSARGRASLLRAGVMQALGRWSYSIYLWHWPLAVGILYFGVSWSPAITLGCLAASVGLGWLSFRFVETPARDLFSGSRWKGGRLSVWAGTSIAVLFVAAGIGLANGLPGRSNGDVAVMLDALAAEDDWAYPRECQGVRSGGDASCYTRKDQPPELILFGDSHAQMFYPLLVQDGWPPTEFVSNVGCPPFPDLERETLGFNCVSFHQAAIQRILASPVKKVVYASIWTPYFDYTAKEAGNIGCLQHGGTCEPIVGKEQIPPAFEAFHEEIRTLVRAGKDVAIVLPIPAPHREIPAAVREVVFEGAGKVEPVDLNHRPEVEEILRAELTSLRQDGAKIIDPRPYLCRDAVCPVTDESGRSLYIDGNHLRPSVVKGLGGMIREFIDE